MLINNNLAATAKLYFNAKLGELVDIYASKMKETPDVQLPKGWKFATVGDYCDDNISNYSKSDSFASIYYLDTGSITENYIVGLQKLNVDNDKLPSRAKRKVFDGDIVYSTVRPNLHHYGLIYNPPNNFIASTGFAVLHNKDLGVSNELLYMWLTKDTVLAYLQAIAENSVSTYPSLSNSDLLKVKIIVPDEETLSEVNNTLQAIYRAITENNKQISSLENSKLILLPKLLSSR